MKTGNSQRQQRVASLINEVLAELLQTRMILKSYSGKCPITITSVKVTPDLKIAYCYYVPFNTQMSVQELQKLLDESSFDLRKAVTAKINLKYSPAIKFYFDSGFDNSNKVEDILKRLKNS